MKYSMKRRIVAVVLVSQFLLGLALTVATSVYSRRQWLTAFDVALEARANSILAELDLAPDGSPVVDWQGLKLPPRDVFELWDDKGKLLWRSQNWAGTPAAVLSSGAARYGFATAADSYRGSVIRKMITFDESASRPGGSKLITVSYASSTEPLKNHLKKIELFAVLSGLLLIGLTGLLGAWAVNRGLAPMQALADEADQIPERNWTFNPPPAAKEVSELAPLVHAMEGAVGGLNRMLSRQRVFIADAAHELKTAVAIVKSSLQLLAYQGPPVEGYEAGLMRALEDCERAEALVCDMLTLARAEQMVEEGRRDLAQPVELGGSCEQAAASLRSIAEAKGIELQVTSDEGVYVQSDEHDLQIVWTNLLENAIQHSPRGSTVSISVASLQSGVASVQVQDSGTGIPEEELPYIFERFRRGDPSRSRTTGGFGLGLAICKAIVNAYGGGIQIESANGCGTRVSVTLPALGNPSEGRPDDKASAPVLASKRA